MCKLGDITRALRALLDVISPHLQDCLVLNPSFAMKSDWLNSQLSHSSPFNHLYSILVEAL